MTITHLSTHTRAAIALIAVLASPMAARANVEFGALVNDWCTLHERIPAQPIPSAFPASCETCHKPGTFDKINIVQPAFDEMKNAKKINDYSWFCPGAVHANMPPALEPIGNRSVNEADLLAILMEATDADADRLSFTASDLPPGASFVDHGDATAELSWTPGFDQAGNYPVTFTVVDDAPEMGSDSERIVISVGDVNRPPTLAPIGSYTVPEGELLAFSVTALDPDGDGLTLSAANLPTGASFTDGGDGTGTLRWTPGFDQAGNYTMIIAATDLGQPAASDSQEVTVTVGGVNRPPSLGTVGNRTVNVAETLTIRLTATDPDGNAVSFSALDLPLGSNLTDHGNGAAELSWTPGLDQVGNHAVTFVVTDDGAPPESDSEEVTLSVGRVNRPPALDPIGDRSAPAGQSLHIVFTATDPDGDDLRFTIEGLPTGARFADNGGGSAELSWTPGADQVGEHPMIVAVSDAGMPGEADSEAFVVIVEAAPTDPPADTTASDVEIRRARWSSENSRLEVRGRTEAFASVEIVDADSREVLGMATADEYGKFGLNVRPYVVPCRVQASGGGVYTEPVTVEGAPEQCGQPGYSYLRLKEAVWLCEPYELRVHGDHAPSYATVVVYDADTGELLGNARADHQGAFHYRGRLAGAPSRVDVGVAVGAEAWLGSPIAVLPGDGCGPLDDDPPAGTEPPPTKGRGKGKKPR